MEKLTVYFDREGNTLSVWFDDPKKEQICEEADDDVVLVKDKDGRVIGFERLNYLSAAQRRPERASPWNFTWHDIGVRPRDLGQGRSQPVAGSGEGGRGKTSRRSPWSTSGSRGAG